MSPIPREERFLRPHILLLILDSTNMRVTQMGTSRTDLHDLIGDEPYQETYVTERGGDLVYDSELAIVAGTDTTSTTLTALVYLLAKHPDKLERLQAEIDPLVTSVHCFSHQTVVGLPLLEGCINEALRLYPAVPSGVQRLTPPEGVAIAGRMIPGNTLVSTPTYTIHRGKQHTSCPPSGFPIEMKVNSLYL